MQRGCGTAGYDGYIIELKVHYPERVSWFGGNDLIARVERRIYEVIPNQNFGKWESGGGANFEWRYLTAGPVGWDPEELYWKVCKAIWGVAGYRWVMFEARPVVVQTGWSASSEPQDLDEARKK